MAGNRVSVVEMGMFCRIELDGSTIFETEGDVATPFNFLDCSKLPVGDAKLFLGCSELHPVAYRKLPLHFTIDAHAGEPFRVIGDLVAPGFLNRQEIFGRVDAGYSAVGSSLDPSEFAASRIPHHVIDLIATGPRTLGTSHVLARNEHTKTVVLRFQDAECLQFLAYRLIQLLP